MLLRCQLFYDFVPFNINHLFYCFYFRVSQRCFISDYIKIHNIITYHINGGGTKKYLAKRGPGCFHDRNNGKDQPLN